MTPRLLFLLFFLGIGCGSGKSATAPDQDTSSESPAHTITQTAAGLTVHTYLGTTHEMVLVPSGPFIMGADNGIRNEGPAHTVDLDAYYIDKAAGPGLTPHS